MDEFDVIKKLAQGGQGSTLLVKKKNGSHVFVLKQCKCENIGEANNALKEAKVLQALSHSHIVRYNDVFLHEDGRFLVICTLMEHCQGGDLACYLSDVKAKQKRYAFPLHAPSLIFSNSV
jgi:serine/threonine protein kinase